MHRFTKIEKEYNHGRGRFTFTGFASGALAYGRANGGRRGYQVMHIPSGKHVRTFATAAAARAGLLVMLPLADWTLPESELQRYAAAVKAAFAAAA